MVYCSKCGKKNPDDARFCNNCSASLMGPPKDYGKEMGDRCEEECSGRKKSSNVYILWVVILSLIAVGIILSLLFRIFNLQLPHEIENFDYWDILGYLVALAIIAFIISVVIRSTRKQ